MRMRTCLGGIAVVIAACHPAPSAPPVRPTVVDATGFPLRIALAEARRGGGVAELLDLAAHGAAATRALALRGLGRIGGAKAMSALLAALVDPDPAIATAAAAAIGIAAALTDAQLPVTAPLLQALRRPGVDRAVIVEALGRAGELTAQSTIAALLPPAKVDALPVVAALALGRFGRRKLPLEPPARAAVIAALTAPDARLRAAAAYALGREDHAPTADGDPGIAALTARLADPDATVRALAVQGLARHKALAPLHALLRDPDWRVLDEVTRALVADPDSATDLTAAIPGWLDRLAAGEAPIAHAVIDAQRARVGHPVHPVRPPSLPPLTRGWIACLGASAGDLAGLLGCDASLPPRYVRGIRRRARRDRGRRLDPRDAALATLAADSDPRVQAAYLGALPGVYKQTHDHAPIAAVVAALASRDPVIASAAVDALAGFDDAEPRAARPRRARRGRDRTRCHRGRPRARRLAAGADRQARPRARRRRVPGGPARPTSCARGPPSPACTRSASTCRRPPSRGRPRCPRSTSAP